MMKKPQPQISPQEPPTPQTVSITSADFKNYYCNNVQIALTSNDIAIICGVILPPEGEVTTIEKQFLMRVSPQTLKGLASSLNQAINGWEEIFGKLPDPPPGLSSDKGIAAALTGLKEKVEKLGEPT